MDLCSRIKQLDVVDLLTAHMKLISNFRSIVTGVYCSVSWKGPIVVEIVSGALSREHFVRGTILATFALYVSFNSTNG